MTRLTHFLIFTGIAILIISGVVSTSLNYEILNMNGTYGHDKIGVTVKVKCNEAFFSRNDIAGLEKYLETQEITCSTQCNSYVECGSRKFNVQIAGVNYRYNDFYSVPIKSGSFFTSIGEQDGNYSVVIGSDLALCIFNTDNVVGQKVRILGHEYEITGVFEAQGDRDSNGVAGKNIIEKLSDDGMPLVYVPIDRVLEYGAVPGIEALQIHTGSSKTLWKDDDKIEAAIKNLGKNTGYYKFTNYMKIEALMWQLPGMPVFIAGCIIIAFLLSYVKRKFTAFIRCTKRELTGLYFRDLVKKHISDTATLILLVAAVCFLCLVVWRMIRFELYIPPEYIAEELIDLQYYSDLFESKVISHNAEMGFIPDIAERVMNIALWSGIFLAASGAFAGIPMIYTGFRQLEYLKELSVKTAAYCSVCMFVSFLLAFFIVKHLGFSFDINIRFLLVICFLLISMVLKMPCETLNKKNEGVYLE